MNLANSMLDEKSDMWICWTEWIFLLRQYVWHKYDKSILTSFQSYFGI